MKWYTLIALAFGHMWLACLVLRIYPLTRDTVTFMFVLKHMGFPANRLWFTLIYYFIPGLLNAPAMLWSYRVKALRATSMPMVYDLALYLAGEFGPEGFPPDLDWSPAVQDAPGGELAVVEPVPEREPHPYFNAFESDTGKPGDITPQ